MPERKGAVKQNKTEPKLFSGNPGFFGGLSNEDELASICPAEFKEDNPWSKFGTRLFLEGANTRNWEWKSDDKLIRHKQFECLSGILGSFIEHEDKEAVAGWMLSEMLSKVPEYLPPKEETSKKPKRVCFSH